MIPHIKSHLNLRLHKAKNLISKHATRVHKHDSHLSLAPLNQIANIIGYFNNLEYAYPVSQIPNNTSLTKQNTTRYKHSFQNRNELSLATRETPSSLISRQLKDIPQIFLKVTTQKKNQCFLPQIILKISCPIFIQTTLNSKIP